jgi:cytochrome c-type biogenesis protein CcmF
MPAFITTIISAILYALGIRDWVAVLGYWIVTFATILTLLEFWKGTAARMKRGENAWVAFSNLIVRNRRRYGGYAIHLGVLIMGFGIIGSNVYQQQTQIRLQAGESTTLGDFTMQFNGVREYPGADDLIIREANLDVFKNNQLVKTLTPRVELYTRTQQPMTIPDARSTASEDFYVLMVNWEGVTATEATFRIYINPLINWVWAGGLVFMIGTLIAAWRDKPSPYAAVVPTRVTALGVSTD